MTIRPAAARPELIGRDREVARLRVLLGRVGVPGAVAVVRGPIGSGKSALVARLTTDAADAGVVVLRTGAAAVGPLPPYAALHQLVGELTDRRAAVLDQAFRFDTKDTPDPYPVALATLELLARRLAAGRAVIMVDNLDRIDVPSRQVLTFLAGRMSELPALLLLTTSQETDDLADAGFQVLRLTDLDDGAARRLLRQLDPQLTSEQRRWVVREAGGNPLALCRLADAVIGHPVDAPDSRVPGVALPGVDIGQLPQPTRDALVMLALAPQLPVSELPWGEEVLAPAVERGWCDVRADRLQFRHPLIGAVLRQSTDRAELERVERMLGKIASLPSWQRLCWRAEVTGGVDEALGEELVAAADTALHRDEAEAALDALELAARHTSDPTTRVERLVAAVTLAVDLGFTVRASRLLDGAAESGLDPLERAVVATYGELLGVRGARGEQLAADLLDVVERRAGTARGRKLFSPSLFRTLYRTRLEPATRTALARSFAGVVEDGIARAALLVHIDPVEYGPDFLAVARRITPAEVPDPRLLHVVASAASAVWEPELASPLARVASQRLRVARMWGLLAESLIAEASIALRLGNVREARIRWHDAEEVAGGEEIHAAGPGLAATRAAVEAQFSSEVTALSTLAEVQGQLVGTVVEPVVAVLELARGRVLLSADRWEDAHRSLRRLFDPADPAYHEYIAGWALADLAESAVLADADREMVRSLLARWQPLADRLGSAELTGQLGLARALLAADGDAEEQYLSAATSPIPYHRARALLAYGMWLRRNRRVSEARPILREAAGILRALGQVRLVERTERELRAAGVPLERGGPSAVPLTAQEERIAHLAARGLSNKQIGAALSLSSRTVGSHLYRMFPKLGITSRSQLRDIIGN